MTDLISRLRTLSRPGGGGSIGNEAADEIERLRAALQLAESALDLGCDALRAEADRYHAEMAGYRPERHQMAEDDYTRAENAWVAVRAVLRELK